MDESVSVVECERVDCVHEHSRLRVHHTLSSTGSTHLSLSRKRARASRSPHQLNPHPAVTQLKLREQMARQVLARASAASATHAKPTQPASNPRKRRQSSPSTSTALASSRAPAASTSLGTLAFDDEGADDAADADVLASSDDDEHDAFPELDLDGSAEEDADEEDSFDGSVHSDDEEDEMDDEELLRLELEAEQNEILSASSDAGDDDDPSDLDELIRRNTSKPDEDEPEPSAIPGQNKAIGEGRNGAAESDLPPDYMRRSRTVRSKLTGKEKKVWDDEIEPEYASDSSTEEASLRASFLPLRSSSSLSRYRRRPTESVTSRNTGTTTSRTSATTSTARRSCVQRQATSSTDSSMASRTRWAVGRASSTRMNRRSRRLRRTS